MLKGLSNSHTVFSTVSETAYIKLEVPNILTLN